MDSKDQMDVVNEISMETHNKVFMHPKKLGVYLFAISISMIFAALSSALIVRKAEGNWLQFDLPIQLLWSSIVIVLSSAALFFAQKAVKKDNLLQLKQGLALTTILGIGFGVLQFLAFNELIDNKIFFGGSSSNPAGSFVYVMAGVHVFHVVIGVLYLLIVLTRSLRNVYSSSNALSIEMCAIYWHFLTFLWVYLYLFLYFNH